MKEHVLKPHETAQLSICFRPAVWRLLRMPTSLGWHPWNASGAPLPAPVLSTIALLVPLPPGKDAHCYHRSPNSTQQFPTTAWKCKRQQDHDPHPQREIVGRTVWVIHPAGSSSTKSSCGLGTAFTKCCILQRIACHLVQSLPNAEEKALHFTGFGLDPPPLIQNNVLLTYFSFH